MKPSAIIKIGSTGLLIVGAIALSASRQFYSEALVSSYFALTLIGATIIHLRVFPSWKDALLVALGSLLLGILEFRILHFPTALAAWFSLAGIASLVILGVRTTWAEGADRRLSMLAFFPAVLFTASEYYADDFLRWGAAANPKVYDLYLYKFDAGLHVQFPFLVGQQFALHPSLRSIALAAYVALSVPITLVYAGQARRLRERALAYFAAFVVTGPVGILFYNLVPALGPAHIFHNDFPWQPLTTEQVTRLFLEPISLPGPRNAIPSLHMAWVLLAWWYSRGLSIWERGLAMFFVVFVGLATLGTGEHYFIDLVVAVPFALFIEALFAFHRSWNDTRRLTALGIGLGTTLVWLVALRFAPRIFVPAPLVPWALSVGTVALSLYCERALTGNAVHLYPQSLATQPTSAD